MTTAILPELKKIRIETSDINGIIDSLIEIQTRHGNLPCLDANLDELIECIVFVGDANYDKENCPAGYVQLW